MKKCNKKSYDTLAIALRYKNILNRKRDKNYNTYKCNKCKKFHLSSSSYDKVKRIQYLLSQ